MGFRPFFNNFHNISAKILAGNLWEMQNKKCQINQTNSANFLPDIYTFKVLETAVRVSFADLVLFEPCFLTPGYESGM